MNQILITEKLYITPELKRKKRMYKIKFFISIFLIVLLCGYYVYAENDRNKSEETSKRILADLWNKDKQQEETQKDTTTKNVVNDVIIVTLGANESERVTNQIVTDTGNLTDNTYTTDTGIDYTVDSILTIPSLDIDYPVISETSDELLKISLNKYWGGAPNTVGNYCIVGHNYGSGKLFGKLYKMQVGDIAVLEDMATRKKVTYEAYEITIVEPDDVSCTSQLTNGRREITLITCSNYGTQRRVIKCREV